MAGQRMTEDKIKRQFLEALPNRSEITRLYNGHKMYKIADGEHQIYAHPQKNVWDLYSWPYNYEEFTCDSFEEFKKSGALATTLKLTQ